MVLMVIAMVVGLWIGMDRKTRPVRQGGVPDEIAGAFAKSKKTIGAENPGIGGAGIGEAAATSSPRQPLQFRAKAVEPEAVLAVLASGKQTVNERVRQLQGMRGISLSKEEHEAALAFLAGREVPEGMGKGSIHWLADELLTVMRMQEPPWEGLAAALGEAAFQPETDPVVRDYIMQHLGHLWEQGGARQEMESALWRAVGTTDETTPGSALIALSRGYERDQQEKNLAEVRRRAFDLAQNPDTGLAVRVTALSIAGDGGGREVTELAENLAKNPETPVILKKVAERIVGTR
ncbi:MAG: hypothetical protein Q8Q59_04595 [Luteolibacter sp.]|jgi:hypothetical protein|nr:hypothetical protein [Luteolibacter sp.]